ncbi:hypothetical protein [Kistimonas asteriae]|uniref:hypothetical protein n=1 Tax=Kistimonas asteriae TaxID=517724 RepID=UPI001BAC08F1|nr:hypothetical protein [Kistimonas asteriae]
MAYTLSFDRSTHPIDVTKTPNLKTHSSRSFGRRIVSATLVIVPHILMHIVLSAASGFEIAVSTPIIKLGQLGHDLGGNNKIASAIFCGIGYFAGFLVSIAAALPGLMIGAVAGIGIGIYQLRIALPKSHDEGVLPALKEGYDSYNMEKRKTAIAVGIAVATLLIASSLILLAGMVGGPPLAGLVAIFEAPAFLASLTILTQAFTHSTDSEDSNLQEQDHTDPLLLPESEQPAEYHVSVSDLCPKLRSLTLR